MRNSPPAVLTAAAFTLSALASSGLAQVYDQQCAAQGVPFAPERVVTIFKPSDFHPSWNRYLADVDGNGVADLLWRHGSKIFVRLGRKGGGFGEPAIWGTWPVAWEINFADVDGNGAADIVGRQADAIGGLGNFISVSLSTGSGFAAPVIWTYWSPSASYRLGDFNNDGKSDLIGQAGTNLEVALSTGSSFAPSRPWTYWNPAAGYRVGDFNGDGFSDVIGQSGSSLQVALSNGSQFAPSKSWGTLSQGTEYSLADVDGDRKTDVIFQNAGQIRVLRTNSRNSAFLAQETWAAVSPNDDILFGDVTGDGRADFVTRRVSVAARSSALLVAPSSGRQFQGQTAWLTEADPTRALLDRVSYQRMNSTVHEFCDRFRRRSPKFNDMSEGYSSNLEAAENYIASKLRNWGYFVFTESVYDLERCGGNCGRNIVALRYGYTVSSQFIDVTAHYDGGYHNDDTHGAKDNAAGVAAVLEIAYSLRDVPTRHAVRYVFFTGEEVSKDPPGSLGFLGSPNGAKDRIVGALNFDTIGTPDNQAALWLRGRASFELGQLMAMQNAIYGLGIGIVPGDVSDEPACNFRVQSDERAYALEGLLAITSLGGTWKTNSNYHTSFDTPDYVDYGEASRTAILNLATVLALDISNRF